MAVPRMPVLVWCRVRMSAGAIPFPPESAQPAQKGLLVRVRNELAEVIGRVPKKALCSLIAVQALNSILGTV